MYTILNIQYRELQHPVEAVSALLPDLGTRQDRIWPRGHWPAMKLSEGLSLGSKGGHGPIRYEVTRVGEAEASFRFRQDRVWKGDHRFILEETPKGCKLTHIIEAKAGPWGALLWPVVIRPLHEALLQDLFTNLESSLSGLAPAEPSWSPYVLILRRMAALFIRG